MSTSSKPSPFTSPTPSTDEPNLPPGIGAPVPIETVNLDQVELTLRQVSDRNLLRAIQDSYFGQPLSVWQERTFDREIAETVWTGTGQVENTLNQDMLTRLPVGEIINDLDPGIYALTAAIAGDDPYEETDATQWFVLSDLGVTTMSGTPEMLMTYPVNALSSPMPTMIAMAMTTTMPNDCSSIKRAAMTLPNSSSDPNDRSMPPAITMMA